MSRASGWSSPVPVGGWARCSPTGSPKRGPRWRWWPAPKAISRRWPTRSRDRPFSSPETCGTVTSTRRSPTARWPPGGASTSGSAMLACRRWFAGPLKTDPDTWREVIEVNLNGSFLGARAAARVMGSGGRIIFTGSVLGERPRKGFSAYSASKAGLVGMAKALALDLAPVGITVNVVAPGWFDSPLTEPWQDKPALSDAILDHTAQQRWGHPRDLVGGVPIPGLRCRVIRDRGPCSTSMGGISLSEDQGRVIAINGAGGTLGSAITQRLAAQPDTRVGAERRRSVIARRDRRRTRRRRCRGGEPAGRCGRSRTSGGGRRHRGRAVRPTRRSHQQRRGALAERPHPQSRHRGLGARLSGQRHGVGQWDPSRRSRDAGSEVRRDRADGLGCGNDRVVACRGRIAPPRLR